jgi:hypothetical protein
MTDQLVQFSDALAGATFAMATKNKVQTYHATMLVTRTEEWCVEAATAEEAKAPLEAGEGHRCSPGEIFCIELREML